MKLRGALMAGAAVAVLGFSTNAQAAEPMSIYEINTFLSKMQNAVNNPDPQVGRHFLARHLDENASAYNTLSHAWANDPRLAYRPVWHNYDRSAYYRYPQAYDPYYRPTSVQSIDKTEILAQFENKKHMIPRYHQEINVLGTRMPADAKSAILDINLKEFGLAYNYAYAPYRTAYADKVLHSDAKCKLHLKKENQEIRLTQMTCNTLLNAPF